MRISLLWPICGLSALCTLPTLADAPLHVVTTQPKTAVTQVLSDLSKQSGAAIVTDDSVTADMPAASLTADNVGAMLAKIDALVPGLQWHKVYLPKNAPVPSGPELAKAVMALESIAPLNLVVAGPTDQVTYTHTFTADASAPTSMQAVYLATDRATPAVKPAPAAPAPTTPVDQTTSGMQTVADVFSKMTPDQQSQALPAMFRQFQRIMATMNPMVRQQLAGQMQQQWQQGQQGQQWQPGPQDGNGQPGDAP